MIVEQIKFIIRGLIRDKVNTLIIVGGLALGLAVCLLIGLYVDNEINYDKQHKDHEKIFRIVTTVGMGDEVQELAMCPKPVGKILKDDYPEVIETCKTSESAWTYRIKYEDKSFKQAGIRDASPGILKLFDYKFLYGDPNSALNNPNSVVIVESLANKIFNSAQEAMGKTFIMDNETATVTAVIKDLPKNCDLQFTALMPDPYTGTEELLDLECYTYVKTKTGNKEELDRMLEQIVESKFEPILTGDFNVDLILTPQPLCEIHFSKTRLADSPKGNKNNLYIFSSIALFVLILACINYINLNSATLSKKLFVKGIFCISGAKKKEVLVQSIIESALLVVSAVFVSIFIVALLIPYLNELTVKDITLRAILKPEIIGSLILVSSSICFISAIMHWVELSGSSALNLINKDNRIGSTGRLRKPLLVMQFMISIIMLIGMLVFHQQLHYMKNKDLGYEHHKIIALIPELEPESQGKLKSFATNLENTNLVKGISIGEEGSLFGGSSEWLGDNLAGDAMIFADEINGQFKQFVVYFIDIDHKFIELLGINVLLGRNFDNNSSENNNNVLINQRYAQLMELGENPVGKTTLDDQHIIGLVEDFHYRPLHNEIDPIVIRYRDKNPQYLFAETTVSNILHIRTFWEQQFGGIPLEINTLQDRYTQAYKNEENELKIINFFTIISLITTCVGLLGVMLMLIDKRIKEIGIRKVNGARIWEVLYLLNSEIIIAIIIGFIFSLPIAFYLFNRWLQNFVERIQLNWWIFILAGIIVSFTALLTSIWHCWRAARRNPVEALRYE